MISPSVAIDYLLDPIGKREIHDEAVGLAVDALRKQIPQNPIQRNYDWRCPTCSRFIMPRSIYYTGDHHCKCGQAIDWSDTNDGIK